MPVITALERYKQEDAVQRHPHNKFLVSQDCKRFRPKYKQANKQINRRSMAILFFKAMRYKQV